MKKNKKQSEFLGHLRQVPIVLVACEKTGLSRNSVYRWRKDSTEFATLMDEALVEGEALVNDMSETQLLTMIKEKNWSAISFWLRHRNPRFRDKVEITHSTKDKELTPEQQELIEKALNFTTFSKEKTSKSLPNPNTNQ